MDRHLFVFRVGDFPVIMMESKSIIALTVAALLLAPRHRETVVFSPTPATPLCYWGSYRSVGMLLSFNAGSGGRFRLTQLQVHCTSRPVSQRLANDSC